MPPLREDLHAVLQTAYRGEFGLENDESEPQPSAFAPAA